MTISTFIYPFVSAGGSIESGSAGRGRVRRFVNRRRLTDEERRNLRDYHRHTHVHSPAIMTAALGGHPPLRRQR